MTYQPDYTRSDNGSSIRCLTGSKPAVAVMDAVQVCCVMSRGDRVMFSIDETLCIGCEKCVAVCPAEAIIMHESTAIIRPSKCTLCGQCVNVCPVNAISEGASGYADQKRPQGQPQQQTRIFPRVLSEVGRMIWKNIGTGGRRGGGGMGRGKGGRGHVGGGGSGRGRR
jgi:ferredoxin